MPERQAITVWALLGERTGDNAQVRALAHGLSPDAIVKRVVFNGLYRVPNIVMGASLISFDRAHSDALEPPWPDVAIGVGRRSAGLQRWLKARSGGLTVTVQIGRPRAPARWFDLVVTTPQYGLPQGPNVIHCPVPLVPAIAAPQGGAPDARLAGLPRPVIGLLAGGGRFPYRFDAAAAQTLIAAASARASALGGSLAVSTSPRTGTGPAAALAAGLAAPGFVYLWKKDGDNPHRAILAAADRFIVTEDSVSMIAEAVRSGRPVELAALPRQGVEPHWSAASGLAAWLARCGLVSPPRDVAALCRHLVAAGHANWLGAGGDSIPAADPLPAVRERIVALVAAARERSAARR